MSDEQFENGPAAAESDDYQTAEDYDDYYVSEARLEEARKWVVDVLKGEFNESPGLSEILADVVISCIPVVGEITAGRDICAFLLHWRRDPKKMDEVMQWVGFVGCCLGLIPELGGVLKGVARMVSHETKAALELAREVVAVLNRISRGNAEKFLLELKFINYLPEARKAANELLNRLIQVFDEVKTSKTTALFSSGMVDLCAEWSKFLTTVRGKIGENFERALKQLDEMLEKIKEVIHESGETTSKQTEHVYTPDRQGQVSYTDERAVTTDKPPEPKPPVKGHPKLEEKIYRPWKEKNAEVLKKDFPTLNLEKDLPSFSGLPKITALTEGQSMWRVFGKSQANPQLTAVGLDLAGDAKAGGRWLGLGKMPENAEEWRKVYAVLDGFNADGEMIKLTMIKGKLPILTGEAAEQATEGVTKGIEQFLPGGGLQGLIDRETGDFINAAIERSGNKEGIIKLLDGAELHFEKKATGWKDANGIHGWNQPMSSISGYYTYPLAATEIRRKDGGQTS
jgi:hypothetical protein